MNSLAFELGQFKGGLKILAAGWDEWRKKRRRKLHRIPLFWNMRQRVSHQWLSLPNAFAVWIGRSQERWESPLSVLLSLPRSLAGVAPLPSSTPPSPAPPAAAQRRQPKETSHRGGEALGPGRKTRLRPWRRRSRPGSWECDARSGAWKERRTSVGSSTGGGGRGEGGDARFGGTTRKSRKWQTLCKCKLGQRERCVKSSSPHFHHLWRLSTTDWFPSIVQTGFPLSVMLSFFNATSRVSVSIAHSLRAWEWIEGNARAASRPEVPWRWSRPGSATAVLGRERLRVGCLLWTAHGLLRTGVHVQLSGTTGQ